jgi:hypothetical protein
MTRSSFRFAVSFVLMLWIAVPVRGATRTWGGNSIFGGSNWSSSENWFDNAPPTNSLTADIAVFRRWEFGPSRIDPTIDSPRSVRGVHVNSGTGVGGIPIFTFGGSNLTLGDVGIDVASNSGSGHVVNNNLILGADQIWTINTSLFVNGSVSGSGFFQKGGTGTLRLAGTGSWTSGGFTIRGGTVQVAGGNAIPNSAQVIFFQDGDVPRQLNLLAHETISGLVSSADVTQVTVQLNGNNLTINGSGGFNSGTIIGSGRLVKSGSLVQGISTANNYSGGTTISSGGIEITNPAGSALGSGNVIVNGTGRLTGSGSVSGAVETFGSGTVVAGLTLGQLDMQGGIAEFNWLGNPIDTTGAANVNSGMLRVSAAAPIDPAVGTTWTFFDAAGGSTGAFTDLDLPDLPAGKDWKVNFGGSGAFLEVVAAALPGDYNQNGAVDAADYTLWRDNLGSPDALPNDDTPGVGPDDYDRWKTNFGQSTGSGSDEFAPVPEPMALWLIALALLFCPNPRRRAAT